MRAAVAVARRLARILWSLGNGCYYDRREKAPITARIDNPPNKAQERRKRGELKLARQKRSNQRILQTAIEEGLAMP